MWREGEREGERNLAHRVIANPEIMFSFKIYFQKRAY